MRPLVAAPSSLRDPETGAIRHGSFLGPLPPLDFAPRGGRGFLTRFAREKRWFYVALAGEDVWVSLAIVRTGYAATAFGFAVDWRDKRMLADATVVVPNLAAEVTHAPHADGVLARVAFGKTSMRVFRRGTSVDVAARFAGLDVVASLDESTAPPPISAIVKLGEGLSSATEKRALTTMSGHVTAGGRRSSLDGGLGGYDYTCGLLPRRTRWRWGFAMGRTKDDRAIGWNVVEGFVGAPECALFVERETFPLDEPRFALGADPRNARDAWTLAGEGLALTFDPCAVHAQDTNLLLVRSRFLQPVGRFRGTVGVGPGDASSVVDGIPGVVEDQDVVW